MSKVGALAQLETAFRHWYWETGREMPDIGILVIDLATNGASIQYLGVDPNVTVDWPALFTGIVQELANDRFVVDDMAAVPFDRRT